MASDQAPIPFPLNPIYNPNDWIDSTNNNIDVAYLNANYLKYPIAQGLENLQAIVVNGSATFNSAVSVPNNDMFVRGMRLGLGGGNQVRNTMLGVNTGNANTTGNNNTFVGALCGVANTTGRDNVFVGTFSGINNTSGFQNTFIGIDAGNKTTTGSRNTHIGRQAGYFNTGDNNICIGDWADASGNISNSMAFGVDVKATASNTIVLGTSSQTTQIAGSIIVGSNSNLTMSAGTGRISQPTTIGDTSTTNSFKLSEFSYNGNNANGTPTTFSFFDSFTARGLYILPSTDSGFFGSTNRRGDCCLTSRGENNGSITISNFNTNMRNGLRVFTSDISNCGLTLQCGQNSTSDWTEFAMNYNRGTNATTTTFNNSINFNPTSTNSNRRLLSGLGTLSFTDISGNNTTNGSFISRIWSDSSSGYGGITGMIYDCSMGGLCGHTFSVSDASGNKINALSVNSNAITLRENLSFSSTSTSERNISNLGTLNFLDLSANTTQGTTISSIYTDSSLVAGIGGQYYRCGINNGYHIFQTRDNAGNETSPIFYGSAISSFSNTLVVRNAGTTSHRLDTSVDATAKTTIRARNTTGTAQIQFDCDNAGLSSNVMNVFPTSLTMKRPIEFDYISAPSNNAQLGYVTAFSTIADVSLNASASVQNIGSFTLPRGANMLQGTARILGSGNHNLTTLKVAFSDTNNTMPAIPSIWGSSLVGYRNFQVDSTDTCEVPISAVIHTPNGGTAYMNIIANWSGGGQIYVRGARLIVRTG